MFPAQLIFNDDFEKVEYNEYIVSRGTGVYQDSLNALLIYTGEISINYMDFMGFIRYDKNLRDILYKMLAVLEEFLKDTLYRLINYTGDKPFGRVTNKNIHLFQKISTKDYGWKTYRNPRLEYGSLVFLYKHFHLSTPSNSIDFFADLDNVNYLRNLVMHHKMLLLDQTKYKFSKNDIINRLSLIKASIKSLYNLLPSNYNKGLISAINKANYDQKSKCIKSKFIYIEKLDGGYENDCIQDKERD